MWFFSKRYFPFWAVFAALLTTACNKDEVILDDRDHAPVITLDSESGVYTVKMGRELTIAPTVEYAEGATYSWIVDGKLAGSEPTYTAVFTELGEVYITFRVETAAGKAEAELRVDVLELTPPVISLALPAEGSRFCRVSNIPSLPIFSIRTRRTSAAGGFVPARSFLRR